jgi:branched-chain amino acid transport system permease protein
MRLLKTQNLLWGIFFAVLLVAGLTIRNSYYLDILISLVFFATMAQAWNIVGGFAGQISIGHVAFLALAAMRPRSCQHASG